MKVVILKVFFIFLLFSHDANTSNENGILSQLRSGIHGNRNRRAIGASVLDNENLINSTTTVDVNYGHMVAIERYGSLACGATLISTRIILSAAHCFRGYSPSILQARVGSLKSESGGKLIDIFEYRTHPLFNLSIGNDPKTDPPHDIAIAILMKEVSSDLGTPAILPQNDVSYAGKVLIISGWGEDEIQDLKFVKLRILSNYECGKIDKWPEKKLCGRSIERNQGGCYGDSGGPLFLHFNNGKALLVGIVASGQGSCASENSTTNSMNVFMYKNWIDNVVKEAENYVIPLIDRINNKLL